MRLTFLAIFLLVNACGTSPEYKGASEMITIQAVSSREIVSSSNGSSYASLFQVYQTPIGERYSVVRRLVQGHPVWVVPNNNDEYTNPFYEMKLNLDELVAVKSPSSFRELLGEPFLLEGPLDKNGTVIYIWKVFRQNKEDRSLPIAYEISAIFSSDNLTLSHLMIVEFKPICNRPR